MEIIRNINYVISLIFTICYFYQFIYIPVVWLFNNRKKKNKDVNKDNNYAVLICARNEESVIPDLVNSIKKQTYPTDKIHTFLLADNCTDDTYKIAKELGVKVYERHDQVHIGKGYALNELIKNIQKDYPDDFDGFFVFDADNILKENYIEKMNESFCDGHEIITSYRNSKNYGTNWISSGIGLWFLRESRYLNNARSIIKQSCAISGTGFMVSSKIIKEFNYTWPYHLLIEDIEFTADMICKGRKIAFCKDAEFFDEQPITFKDSWNQRVRWTKGYVQVLQNYGISLFAGIFQGSFSCFDLLMNILPAFVLSTISIICNLLLLIIGLISDANEMVVLLSFGEMVLGAYMCVFAAGFFTTITEWKHINTTSLKKILYMFTFPIFMLTFVPVSIYAVFAKAEWKPIKHSVSSDKLTKTEKKIIGI